MAELLPSNSRMGDLRIDEVIHEFGGPVLFIARNDLGAAYLAISVEKVSVVERFLYTPVSEYRLIAVRSGLIGLREAIATPEQESTILVEVGANATSETTIRSRDIPAQWLPSTEARLDLATPSVIPFSPKSLGAQAHQQQRNLLALEFEPPAAVRRTEFPLRHLSSILTEYQELADAMGPVVVPGTWTREAAQDVDYSIVQYAAASVVVVIAPFVGERLVAAPNPAAKKVQDVIAGAGANNDLFSASLEGLPKRVLTHVRDFLQSLSDSGTGITIHDAQTSGVVTPTVVSLERVRSSIEILRSSHALPTTSELVVGYLTAIDHLGQTFGVTEVMPTEGRKKVRTLKGVIDGAVMSQMEDVSHGHSISYRFTIQTEEHEGDYVQGLKPRKRKRLVHVDPIT